MKKTKMNMLILGIVFLFADLALAKNPAGTDPLKCVFNKRGLYRQVPTCFYSCDDGSELTVCYETNIVYFCVNENEGYEKKPQRCKTKEEVAADKERRKKEREVRDAERKKQKEEALRAEEKKEQQRLDDIASRSETITDSRDGHAYKVVKIGDQVWMAENLNYADSANYPSLRGRSWCYNDDKEKCAKYGRLYTWSVAMDSAGKFSKNGKGCGSEKKCSSKRPVRGICPSGWHLPESLEWKKLYETVGKSWDALMQKDERLGREDKFGFSAQKSGYYGYDGFEMVFDELGSLGYFWSASDDSAETAIGVVIGTNLENNFLYKGKTNGYSIRCVKD